MPSSAVDAQEAFVELLAAAEAFADAAVLFAGNSKLPDTFELAWVMPVRNYRLEPGEQFRTETYDLVARFEVFRSGDDAGADADARRWDLIDAADAELRRTDFRGYYSKGGELEVVQASLDHYDKGWVAVSLVTFGVEVWRP